MSLTFFNLILISYNNSGKYFPYIKIKVMEAQKVCASYIKPDSYSMVDYVFNILSETPNFGQS